MSFIRKYRGAPTATIAAEYECEVHGRFEIDVERDPNGDAPDVIPCPVLQPGSDIDDMPCGRAAIWCISAPLARVRRIEAAVKGKWQKPEFKTWTDTSAIAEGQPLYEWKEDRAKVWEEKRRQDVVDFAREHNERVIGGD